MQDAITLVIVALAGGYTLYAGAGVFFVRPAAGGCGGACRSCPEGNKKGEPLEWVPLQGAVTPPKRMS